MLANPEGLLMLSSCKEKEAAWEFMKHMSSGDPVRSFTQKRGLLPVRKSLAEEPAIQADSHRRMDVFRPENVPMEKALPVMVFAHGGGWRAGDKDDGSHAYRNFALSIAGHGVVVASINYRLAPEYDWRVQAADVAQAMAFICRRAQEFGGDGSRIIAAGHSAGGHLASLVSFDDTWLDRAGFDRQFLRGLVSISGVYDVEAFALEKGNLRSLVRPAFGEDPSAWSAASPINWAGPDDPPSLLVVGADDDATLIAQTKRLSDVLATAGVVAGVVQVEGADHFSVIARSADPDYTLVCDIADFIATWAGEPEAAATNAPEIAANIGTSETARERHPDAVPIPDDRGFGDG
jgi:acetyl esterase/lipase